MRWSILSSGCSGLAELEHTKKDKASAEFRREWRSPTMVVDTGDGRQDSCAEVVGGGNSQKREIYKLNIHQLLLFTSNGVTYCFHSL
ncbi:unnamed protein product [Lactuca virosa]|uniref:Uncharacterized protein n=1 Tax=Lactuca virosa TaxID=75947 RepID=A0AAU9LMC2_9ASTR|nr:unnamed protein product [Lactuca virosa]